MNVDGSKKRNKMIMLSAVVCVAIAIITFAASRSLKKIENSFVSAGANIVIVENENVVDGRTNSVDFAVDDKNYTATKAVSIKNTGGSNPVPLFVRVCIYPRFETDGYELQTGIMGSNFFPTSVTGNSFTIDGVTFNLASGWDKNWSYSNGYFYYINNNGVLDVGKTTEGLLASVSVDKTDYTNNYVKMGSLLKVVVLADSIQTVGMTRESNSNVSAVVQRWGSGVLTGQDVQRPAEQTEETSASISGGTDSVVSSSAVAVKKSAGVITNYEKQRIQNMITSITVYGPPEADYYEDDEETEDSEESVIDDTADVPAEEDTATNGDNDESENAGVEESEVIGEE